MLDIDSARRDAAQILRPLYEADGEQRKLLRVLDIETELADGPSDRLVILSQAMMVAEQSLNEIDAAFAYASRGLREAAGEGRAPAVDRARRAPRRRREQDGRVRRAPSGGRADILDEQQQLDVLVKIAELSRDRLGDGEAAREYFEKALQIGPTITVCSRHSRSSTSPRTTTLSSSTS